MEYTDNRLPESWIPAVLRDVVTGIVGGGTPDKSQKHYYQGNIPWMTVKDMHQDVLDDTIDHISPEAVANSSTKLIPANTPIVATRMSLGKIVRAPFTVAINQDLKAIFLNESVDGDYFVYWYRSIAQHIENMGTGTTVKGIRLENLYTLQIPLPPLPEQHYIAGRLDNLLARADAAQARLQGLPTQLKYYRQAVLAAAVSGDLTADWREQTGCLKEWEKTSLNQVCRWGSGGTPSRKNADYYGGDIPWVKTGDLGPRRLTQASEYITRLGLENSSAKIFPKNSVLMAMYGATIGKVSILDMEAATNQACAVGIVIEDVITHDFLYYFLLSQKEKFIELGKGGAQPNISQTIIKNYPIALPTLPEQTEIVRRAEKLLAHADTVELAVSHSLQQLALLNQSLLARAFNGELSAAWRAKAN